MDATSKQLQGRYEEAVAVFRAGNYPGAAARFERMLDYAPDNAVLWTSLGASLQLQGRYERARECYRRAIDLDPNLADAHSNLGTVLQGLRRIDDAMESFRAALRIDPRHLDAVAGIGALLDWQGRYAEGLELVEPVAARAPGHSELTVTYARLLRRAGRLQEATALIERALAGSTHGPAYRQRMHFLLGDLDDESGRYDDAFAHYREGNRLKGLRYDPAAYRALVDSIIDFYTPARLSTLPRASAREPALLFIVGMPRSGSSLVEQILAVHPRVHAAGELELISAMAARMAHGSGMPFPENARSLTEEMLDESAEDFRKAAGIAADGVALVTDKTPGNFLFLGLIELMFPNARVINCRRDPLDTCLSCYFQNFGGVSLPFSYDLAHIGEYYREYERLMRHWRGASGLPIKDTVYEDLVVDQEGSSRALIDFAGLSWDPRCLRFHEIDRTATTASHAQVRRPMYTSSIGRHRHYARHLAPLKAALGLEAGESPGARA